MHLPKPLVDIVLLLAFVSAQLGRQVPSSVFLKGSYECASAEPTTDHPDYLINPR